MKKIVVLLVLLWSGWTIAYAQTAENNSKAPSAVQNNPSTNDTDKIGVGSGDDTSTPDDGDPTYDNPPAEDEAANG
jgi:hypothetical protein